MVAPPRPTPPAKVGAWSSPAELRAAARRMEKAAANPALAGAPELVPLRARRARVEALASAKERLAEAARAGPCGIESSVEELGHLAERMHRAEVRGIIECAGERERIARLVPFQIAAPSYGCWSARRAPIYRAEAV